MLWGQNIKVFTDHTNLMRDALGLTLDPVYLWRLLLEVCVCVLTRSPVVKVFAMLGYQPMGQCSPPP
jgi:hypothetical protein